MMWVYCFLFGSFNVINFDRNWLLIDMGFYKPEVKIISKTLTHTESGHEERDKLIKDAKKKELMKGLNKNEKIK